MALFTLTLISPDGREMFEGVSHISGCTELGCFTILPQHEAIVLRLISGKISVIADKNKKFDIQISDATLVTSDNECIVTTEHYNLCM